MNARSDRDSTSPMSRASAASVPPALLGALLLLAVFLCTVFLLAAQLIQTP